MHEHKQFFNAISTQIEGRRTDMQTKTKTKPKSLVALAGHKSNPRATESGHNDEPVKLTKFQPYDSLSRNDIGLKQAPNKRAIERNQFSGSMEIKSLSTNPLAIADGARDERPGQAPDPQQPADASRHENQNQHQHQHSGTLVLETKWPVGWFGQSGAKPDQSANSNSPPILNSKSTPDLARTDSPFDSEHSQPFQLVWSRLAFEPKLSTYERLLSCSALRRARRLFKARAEPSDEPATSVKASSRRKSRLIFDNLNGHINSHELTAILGPSGSGKTSLLNAICGRTDDYRGLIELRGVQSSKRRLRLSIIPQKDYLIENLTVWENLIYSSKILNSEPGFRHEPNIMRVVKMLKLTNCLDSSVSKISGGEYKRVSIAQELLRQPDILVLDEPTSGLDSMNCKNLVLSLLQLTEASRKGAIRPIAIVLSIHQPDVEIFHLFDHVYCMAKRGRVIFDGRPADVLALIRQQAPELVGEQAAGRVVEAGSAGVAAAAAAGTPTPLLPVTLNPANLLIEIASEDVYGREHVERLAKHQLEQFERAYYEPLRQDGGPKPDSAGSNPIATKVNQMSHNIALGSKGQPKSKSLISFQQLPALAQTGLPRSTLSSILAHKADSQLVRDKQLDTSKSADNVGKFCYHTGLLTRRAFKSTIRDPLMTLISLVFHLSIPFVMWTVYSRDTGSVRACPVIQREMELLALAQNSTMQLVARQQEQLISAIECSTMFFLSTYSFSMCSLSIAALAFPLNMHVLLKETRNGWYSLPAFVVAKTLASFLFEVIFPVASLVMIYLMLGMPSSVYQWRLLAIAAVMALISMLSHTQGLIFGALCMDSVQTAIFLASALTLPQTVLSGFTARIKHMPYLLQKLSWLSMYRYSSDSINVIRFGFGICECNDATDDYLKTKRPTFVDAPQSVQNLLNFYLTSNRDNLGQDHEHSSVPGVTNELIMNATARNQTIERLESRQVNLFEQMAELTMRSFSYGKPIEDCSSVKSQLLATVGAPDDHYLPYLFAGMIALLVVTRAILFVVVKYKLASRI